MVSLVPWVMDFECAGIAHGLLASVADQPACKGIRKGAGSAAPRAAGSTAPTAPRDAGTAAPPPHVIVCPAVLRLRWTDGKRNVQVFLAFDITEVLGANRDRPFVPLGFRFA